MESLSTSTRISYKKIRKDSKKYNQVSCLQKHQLIELILSDEYTIRKAALKVGVKYLTAKFIWNKFRKSQKIQSKKHNNEQVRKQQTFLMRNPTLQTIISLEKQLPNPTNIETYWRLNGNKIFTSFMREEMIDQSESHKNSNCQKLSESNHLAQLKYCTVREATDSTSDCKSSIDEESLEQSFSRNILKQQYNQILNLRQQISQISSEIYQKQKYLTLDDASVSQNFLINLKEIYDLTNNSVMTYDKQLF